MSDPVRHLAVEILDRVGAGNFLDEVLGEVEGRLPEPEQARARLRFLTVGTIKMRGRLDHELEQRLPRGLDSLPDSGRSILRLALYETRFGNAPGYAVVNDAVQLAREYGLGGLSGLVNGVLRTSIREGEPEPAGEGLEALAVSASHPLWLLRKVDEVHGRQAVVALTEWDNRPPPLWVRAHPRRDEGAQFLRQAADGEAGLKVHEELAGYVCLPAGLTGEIIEALQQGWLTVQDPSAALATLAAGPLSGRIADLCAAPGGKTTHLAERAAGRCEIVATDADGRRYGQLTANLARHAEGGVVTRPYDTVVTETSAFDLVLIDAPCSNLGVLRRRADARWRVDFDEVVRLATVQRSLLERGAELVGPGGVVIYSTCTILREENETVVEGFLSDHPGFAPDELPGDVPDPFRSGTGTAVSLPWRHGVDGAFVTRLRRQGP